MFRYTKLSNTRCIESSRARNLYHVESVFVRCFELSNARCIELSSIINYRMFRHLYYIERVISSLSPSCPLIPLRSSGFVNCCRVDSSTHGNIEHRIESNRVLGYRISYISDCVLLPFLKLNHIYTPGVPPISHTLRYVCCVTALYSNPVPLPTPRFHSHQLRSVKASRIMCKPAPRSDKRSERPRHPSRPRPDA